MLSSKEYTPQVSHQVLKRIRSCWGRLSQHDIARFERNRDKFCDSVTEHYFLPRSRVESQIREWELECHGTA